MKPIRSVERAIRGEEKPTPLLEGALRGASVLYGAGVSIHRYLYALGVSRVTKIPAPVISVGNLTVGGTGKTPFVTALAEMMNKAGLRVAVLSRGYGRRGKDPVVLVSDGKDIRASVEDAGDEPLMMARRLSGIWIWVGPSRLQTGLAAWEASRPEVYILDDGFQHRQVDRDLNIVVLRAPNPFGNGKLLPAGPLREPPRCILRADAIVLNVSDDPESKDEALRTIRKVAPDLPCFEARYRARRLFRLQDLQPIPLEKLEGLRVSTVSAIADPGGFHRIVTSLGAEIGGRSVSFRDHHWYTGRDLEKIRALLEESDAVLTTEKDAWKLRQAEPGTARLSDRLWDHLWVLGVDFVVEPESALTDMLEKAVGRKIS